MLITFRMTFSEGTGDFGKDFLSSKKMGYFVLRSQGGKGEIEMANIVDGPKEIMQARMRRYSKSRTRKLKTKKKKKKGEGRWHGELFPVRGVVSGGLPSLGRRR
jgi:hypothetical protein